MAELITPTAVKRVLDALRRRHDLVIVDCTSWFNETTLAILDAADTVLTILSLEITSIKNMRLFLEVADQLGYEHGKVKLVLNRAGQQPRHPGDRCRELDRPEGRPHDRQRRSKRGVRAQPGGTLLPVEPGGRGLPDGIPRLAQAVAANASRRGRMMPARTRRKSHCSHSDDHVGRWEALPSVKGSVAMSLLKRIESARPGSPGVRAGGPAVPPGPGAPGGQPPTTSGRLMTQAPVRESFRDVKFRIQSRVIQDLDPKLDLSNHVEVRRQIEEMFNKFIDEEGVVVTRVERQKMLESILDEILGFGPIEPLLKDDTDLRGHGQRPAPVYVERKGKLRADRRDVPDDEHVMRIIDRIVAPIGRRVDESSPMVDARLPDGSPRQRDHPAARAGRPGGDDPPVRASRSPSRTCIKFGTATADDGASSSQGVRRSAAQHADLRRHRLG